jgi:hypothetical protein
MRSLLAARVGGSATRRSVWCTDAARDGMPVAGHAEREMPHSRRQVARRPQRRAQRSLEGRVPHSRGSGRATTSPRVDPPDAPSRGRSVVSETKPRDRLPPMADELPFDNLLEPIPLTPEQIVAQAEADERDRQRQLEWDAINAALSDDAMAVTRAMRRFRQRRRSDPDRTRLRGLRERLVPDRSDGRRGRDRPGPRGRVARSAAPIDQDYGDGPAMVIAGRPCRGGLQGFSPDHRMDWQPQPC